MRLKRKITQETAAKVQPRRKVKVVDVAQAKQTLASQIDEYEAFERQIQLATEQLASLREQIYAEMKSAKIEDFHHSLTRLQEIEDKTRTVTTIDPQKYYDAVGDEALFFDTISVPITQARKALSQREIERIADIKHPEVLGKKLKISKIAPK